MKKDLIIVGGGGFGREALQWAKDCNREKERWNILGFVDDNLHALDQIPCDYPILGEIGDWNPEPCQEYICAIANPWVKERVTNILKSRGAIFVPLLHPTSFIAEHAQIGEGLVMYPNSGVGPNVKIGDFVTILSSGIGHDAEIGDYTTISSYCDITGGVKIADKVFLGSHVTVIPKKRVASGAYVGAGSVVMTNIKAGYRVMGNPAVKIKF